MGNLTGSGLSPDPVGFHSEALGDFVSCQQSVHRQVLSVGNRAEHHLRGASQRDCVQGARVLLAALAGAEWDKAAAGVCS
jgi:hypothetical protein